MLGSFKSLNISLVFEVSERCSFLLYCKEAKGVL